MTEQELIKQLKSAKAVYDKTGAPDQQTIAQIQGVLLARIVASAVAPVTLSKSAFFLGFLRYLLPSQLAYGAAVFALIISAAGAGVMFQKALPGESLYSAKIAMEATQMRFVSNPAQRAQRQMEMAGERLVEAEQVQAPEQKTQAIKRFSQEIKQAKATLGQASDPLQVEAATKAMSEKAREYEEKLMQTKAQAGTQRQVGVALVEEAEAALKDIHNPAL